MSCQLGYMVQGWTLVTLGAFHAGPGQDGGGGFMHVSVSASGDAPVQLPGAATYHQSSNDYGHGAQASTSSIVKSSQYAWNRNSCRCKHVVNAMI